MPGEDIGSDANAGSVQLFTSDTEDIDPGPSLDQDTAGVSDSTESGDTFGDQVAWAAPGLGDTVTRLAVSAPKENGAAADTGMVQVFPINNLGAESTYTQNTAGIPGGAEAGDKFGSTLAVVEGAAERVLLVGVPDDVGNSTGMVERDPVRRRHAAVLEARHRWHLGGRRQPLRRRPGQRHHLILRLSDSRAPAGV